jgi:hypothetical protein
LAILVAGWSVGWTFLTGVVGELGEQARFRTVLQPLTVTLMCCLAFVVFKVRRGRQRDT